MRVHTRISSLLLLLPLAAQLLLPIAANAAAPMVITYTPEQNAPPCACGIRGCYSCLVRGPYNNTQSNGSSSKFPPKGSQPPRKCICGGCDFAAGYDNLPNGACGE
jgi:hypothetical protein